MAAVICIKTVSSQPHTLYPSYKKMVFTKAYIIVIEKADRGLMYLEVFIRYQLPSAGTK